MVTSLLQATVSLRSPLDVLGGKTMSRRYTARLGSPNGQHAVAGRQVLRQIRHDTERR